MASPGLAGSPAGSFLEFWRVARYLQLLRQFPCGLSTNPTLQSRVPPEPPADRLNVRHTTIDSCPETAIESARPLARRPSRASVREIAKAPTGVQGLDEVTGGGLPRGRPTLVCGGPGSGKTLLAMEFIVKGAMDFGEPGVFVAFEETAEELTANVRSLGFDLDDLIERKKLAVDYVHIERSEIEEAGEYDLEGLFIRLGYAIDSIGAKRVVIDTVETHLRRLRQPRAAARRAAATLPLAQGQGRHRGDHRRARRRLAHPAGPRGVRLGLRDPARPPADRAGGDPPAADRQVPWHLARHQRVSLHHRRARVRGAAGHFDGSRPRGLRRAHLDRSSPPRHHARRQGRLPRLELAGVRHRRQRQEQPRGFLRPRLRRARRALPLFRVRGVAGSDPAQHALDRDRSARR